MPRVRWDQEKQRSTHPQTVDALKGVSALLGLPLAFPPALPARNIGRVRGRVGPLSIGAALHADSIVLQTHRQRHYNIHFQAFFT